MIVKKYSIKNQQKIAVGILSKEFYTTFKWFHKFDSKKETIVKVEFSSIDIEKILKKSLFFKNGLTSASFEECVLEDILDWNIFIPNQVKPAMLGHPILLKRNMTYDDLHISIYCFKGTLKAIKLLLKYNSLPWYSKANRTDEENKIISHAKYHKSLGHLDFRELLINDLDYEVVDRIYDIETLELLIEDEEVPFTELLEKRLCEFTESQDMNPETYIEDY